MRCWIAGFALVATALAAHCVEAAPWDFRARTQSQGQPPQNANDKRGARGAQDERRIVPNPPDRPAGRLTEEERRELRRDVDRANAEIYRRRNK